MTDSSQLRAGGAVHNLSVRNKIGLVLAVFLAVNDIAGPFTFTPGTDGQPGPPLSILVISAVLGVLTLITVVYTWRTGRRLGARLVAGTRLLSILGAVPGLFVRGVPPWTVALVAIFVLLTIGTVLLLLARPPAPAIR